jgi:hypothetical protein
MSRNQDEFQKSGNPRQHQAPVSRSAPCFFLFFSFRVHHLVNRDDRHLLAHAMASDFSVTWQCLSKRTIGFSLRKNSTPFSDKESPRPVRSAPCLQSESRCIPWCSGSVV